MPIVVILVHGTWGKADDAWYRRTNESSFRSRLTKTLSDRGIASKSVHFISHEWSGENKHADRLDAAKTLSATLIETRTSFPDAAIHIVAHSHGGNVALKGIELYIKDSIVADVPKLIDHRNIVDTSREFLERYKLGEFPLLTDNEAAKPLIDRLSNQLDTIAHRSSRRFRFSALTEGSIYDLEESHLRHLLKKVYVLLYSYAEAHRIQSLITLGTPFYEKTWTLAPHFAIRENLFHHILNIWFAINLIYIDMIIIAALAAILPSVPWVGFNPFFWHWSLLAVGGAIALWLGIEFVRELDAPDLPQNTNLYFDEASVAGYLVALRGRPICRVLNVNASYLDEAFCVLSAYPTLSGLLLDRFSWIIRPRIWTYERVFRQVGASPWSVPDQIRRLNRRIWRITTSLMLILIFPIRYALYWVSQKFIAHSTFTDLRASALGVPLDENAGGEISIREALGKPYFDSYRLMVGKILATEHINRPVDKDRFEFLWDEQALEKRLKESALRQRVKSPLSTDQSRQLLAIEERIKEYYGVSSFRHSMYYDNDAVIDAIADFLTGTLTENMERVSTEEISLQ